MNFSSEQGNLSPALVCFIKTYKQASFGEDIAGNYGAVIGMVDNRAVQMLIPNLLQNFAPGRSN